MPSTVVASFEYNPVLLVLRVVFVSGSIYEYRGVPEDVYLEMKASGSKGTFLNQFIKGHYVFKKIR